VRVNPEVAILLGAKIAAQKRDNNLHKNDTVFKQKKKEEEEEEELLSVSKYEDGGWGTPTQTNHLGRAITRLWALHFYHTARCHLKVNFTLQHATNCQRGNRGTAIIFL
jgi:hypothetical protein